MGAVTGKGLADLIRERFGVRTTALAMLALLIANVTTVVAEFAGIAAASEIFGVSRYVTVPAAAALVFLVVVYGSYRRVEVVLLTVSLVFLSYVITGFMARPDWGAVGGHLVVPTFHFTLPYLTILIGLIGTTITPWMQFYLQSSVVDKGLGEREYSLVRLDVWVGSFLTNFIAFFIIVTTAATLFAHGKPADTVTDVAQTLRPLAGRLRGQTLRHRLAERLSYGRRGAALSTAYAVCEAFGWERSVNRPFREAPAFLGLFAALIAIGAAAVLIPGVPLLTLMFLPNVVAGILLPLILFLMLKLVNDRRIMGSWVNSPVQNVIARLATGLLIALTGIYLVIAVLEGVGVVTG